MSGGGSFQDFRFAGVFLRIPGWSVEPTTGEEMTCEEEGSGMQ